MHCDLPLSPFTSCFNKHSWGVGLHSLYPHLRLKWVLMTDRAKHARSEPELSGKKHVVKLCQITFRKGLIETDLHCKMLKETHTRKPSKPLNCTGKMQETAWAF